MPHEVGSSTDLGVAFPSPLPRKRRASGGWVALATLALLIGTSWAFVPTAAGMSPSSASVAAMALESFAVSHGEAASWNAAHDLGLVAPSPSALFGYDAGALSTLADARPVPASTPETLGVELIPSDPQGLRTFALAVSTPGNPLQGQFLTQQQYIARFGPTPAAEAAAEQELTSHGFTILTVSADRSFLQVRGNAGDVDQLFSTQLLAGYVQGEPAVLPSAAPSLPPSLSPYVLAVSGLQQNVHPFALAPLSAHPYGATPAGGPCTFTCNTIFPDWTHFMYGLDNIYNASGGPHWATSSTIGILLWAGSQGGFDPADIQAFASGLYPGNQPPFTYNPYPLDGAGQPGPNAPQDPSNAPMELTLDMEWSESQAPGATLDVVYVPEGTSSNGYSPSPVELERGMAFLLNLTGLTVVTQSFGAPEGDLSFQAIYDTDFEQAASRGISVFAASGDNGGSDGGIGTCTQNPQVEYPASSPWVTAVGGTAPLVNATAGGGPNSRQQGVASEPAWHGSGGGYSGDYGLPTWQRSGSAYLTIEKATNGAGARGVPDVAGPAANDTFFYNGNIQDGEGTSFASPFWAGLTAEMVATHGAPLGFLNPRLYALGAAQDAGGFTPQPFREIPQGQTPGLPANCLYYAQYGWDPITGYGTPENALSLYADLVASYITLTVSFSPSTAAPGGSVDIHIQAMNGSRAYTGGPITVTIFTLPQTLRRTTLLTTDLVTLDSTGSGDDNFAIPVTYPYGQLLVQAQIFTKHEVGSADSVLTVTLLGSAYAWLQPLLAPPLSYIFFLLIMGLATALGWVLGLRQPKRTVSQPFYRRLVPGRQRAPPPGVYVPGAGGAPGPGGGPGSYGRPANARGQPSGPRPSTYGTLRPAQQSSTQRAPSLGGRPATKASVVPQAHPSASATAAAGSSTPRATSSPSPSSRIAPGTQADVAPGVTMVVPPKPEPTTAPTTATEPSATVAQEPLSSATPVVAEAGDASAAPATPSEEAAALPSEGEIGTSAAPSDPAVGTGADVPLPSAPEQPQEAAVGEAPSSPDTPLPTERSSEGSEALPEAAPASPEAQVSSEGQASDSAAAPVAETLPTPPTPSAPPTPAPIEEPVPAPAAPETQPSPVPTEALAASAPVVASAPRKARVRRPPRAASEPAPTVQPVQSPPPAPAPPKIRVGPPRVAPPPSPAVAPAPLAAPTPPRARSTGASRAQPAPAVQPPHEGLVQRMEEDVVKIEKKVSRAVRRGRPACKRCGAALPTGAKSCPTCQAPVRT